MLQILPFLQYYVFKATLISKTVIFCYLVYTYLFIKDEWQTENYFIFYRNFVSGRFSWTASVKYQVYAQLKRAKKYKVCLR